MVLPCSAYQIIYVYMVLFIDGKTKQYSDQ